ncbi:hypothetical protein [Bradyrhizobium centrosematis]|uniref:hypothetical protein n=1 Tax=Bradyrhizobium centrosematis TaxID=1300039 RepID=UPI0021675245|nr:hypothetical protein [Bradyrhizobium centrosematis]MCS3765340.1 capsular polysaccharide biosynthesis protein [Bradyrhizobium centrosematis]MCS3773960.1 capsular polysaccharide biosynthesis protein [Bradyrhizobium centrosematis]
MQEDLAWIKGRFNVLRQSSRLVLIGTVAFAIIGGIPVFVTNPRIYESHMVLPLGPRVLGLLKSEAVLDPVVESITGRPPTESDRRSLANSIAVSAEMSRASNLYTVGVEAKSPGEAQSVLERILKEALKVSKPSGSSRDKIEQEIRSLDETVADLRKLSNRLNDNAEHVSAGAPGEMYARAFIFLLSEIRVQEQRLLQLKDELEGLRVDDVIVRPTLSSAPKPQRLVWKLTVVAVAAFLFVCLVILIRDEWRRSSAAVI